MTSSTKHIGLVAGNATGHPLELAVSNAVNGYQLKKIFIQGDLSESLAKTHYPQAEIVGNLHDIIHDESIDLVLVEAPQGADLGIVKEVLDAGKHVRIL